MRGQIAGRTARMVGGLPLDEVRVLERAGSELGDMTSPDLASCMRGEEGQKGTETRFWKA